MKTDSTKVKAGESLLDPQIDTGLTRKPDAEVVDAATNNLSRQSVELRVDPRFPCTIQPTSSIEKCERVFDTLRGLSIHQRRKHPVWYHEKVRTRQIEEREAQPLKRRRWCQESLALLARSEVDYRLAALSDPMATSGVRQDKLNRYLSEQFPTRTMEAIRKQRLVPAHIELVSTYMAEIPKPCEISPIQTTSLPARGGRKSKKEAPVVLTPIGRRTRSRSQQLTERVSDTGSQSTTSVGGVAPSMCTQTIDESFSPSQSPSAPVYESARPNRGLSSPIPSSSSSESSSESDDESVRHSASSESSENLEPDEHELWKSKFTDFLNARQRITRCSLTLIPGEEWCQYLLDERFAEWLEKFLPDPKPQSTSRERREPKRSKEPVDPSASHKNRNRRRQQQRAFERRLFDKDQSLTIRKILEGDLLNTERVAPEIPGQFEYWSNLIETPSGPDARIEDAPVNCLQWGTVGLVTGDEYLCALTKMKDGAPGFDGLKKEHMKLIPGKELIEWFNLWLFLGYSPSNLKRGVTTLIPKVKEPTEPRQFRPITVCSMIIRLFHSIVAKRLADVPISLRQKGFRNYDGVGTNVWLLKGLVSNATRSLKPMHLAFLDVQKAFDTVSHASMLSASQRVGIPPPLLQYLKSAHEENTTFLKSDPARRLIRAARGVKQGDPLACYLFNFAMDRAISGLDPNIGVDLGSERVNAGLLADDTFLAASSPGGLQLLLKEFEQKLRLEGMELNPSKCATLSVGIRGKEKQWFCDSTPFLLSGKSVPTLKVNDTYKYLGVQYSLAGTKEALVKSSYLTRLARLDTCSLKPQDRLYALRTFLMPSVYHTATLATRLRPSGWLTAMDLATRRFVRKWLHLPKDTPDSYLYASAKDGGLGIKCLALECGRLRLERLESLQNQSDAVVGELLKTEAIKSQLEQSRKPVLVKGTRTLNTGPEIQAEWAKSLHATVDGVGLSVNSSLTQRSSWVLRPGPGLTGREFVEAIQVRGNALATRSRSSRGRPLSQSEANHSMGNACPSCPDKVSNLAHVLQTCIRSQELRILRHNRLAARITTWLRKDGFKVVNEPRILSGSSYCKPDIVAVKGGVMHVLDPVVCADNATHADYHRDKATRYDTPEVRRFAEQMATDFNSGVLPSTLEFTVKGLVINWRGMWSNESYDFLTQRLNLPRPLLDFWSIGVLREAKGIWTQVRKRPD
jgi:hypothetical protein